MTDHKMKRPSADEMEPAATASDTVTPAQAGAPPADEYDEWIARRGDKRGAFGSVSLKLSHPPIPGFVIRWVNDAGDGLRMSKVIEAGFDFVKGPDGRRITRIVGVGARGDGLRAYLMKRPEAFSLEDRAALQQARDALLEQTMTQVKEGQYLKPGPDGKPINSMTERAGLK